MTLCICPNEVIAPAITGLYAPFDYAIGLSNLLPPGRAWPREETSTQFKLMQGLAVAFARSDAAAVQLLRDANPATTFNLLPEWEESLGLPDPCLGASPTIAQRQASVLARFTGVGGETAAYIESYAAALGYTVTLEPNAPLRIGIGTIQQPIQDESYFFVLTISCPEMNSALECELNGIMAAHVQPVYET
jgi:uncharacterized protein YmfQ (DUF2313 family)